LSQKGENYFNPNNNGMVDYLVFDIKLENDKHHKSLEIPLAFIEQTRKMRSPVPFVLVVFDKDFKNWIFNFLSSVGVEAHDIKKSKPIYGYYCSSKQWININSDFKQAREKSKNKSSEIDYFKSLFNDNFNIFNVFNLSMYENAWLATDKIITKETKLDFSNIERQIGIHSKNMSKDRENSSPRENKKEKDDLDILQKNSHKMKEGIFPFKQNKNEKENNTGQSINPLKNLFNDEMKNRLIKDLDNASEELKKNTENNVKNNIKNGEYLFK
jgi:hypothetical protein